MSYVQPQDSGRRFTGIVIVVALHALLGYALVNGLARKIVQVISEPLETKIIEEVKPPPDKPPPPPPPKLAPPPPPYIPPPEVQVQLPASIQQHSISAVTSVKPPAPVPPPPARPHVPKRAAAIANASACDKPEYPPASLRAQESGIVTLGFLIDVDGRVLESKVERSSGARRLDEAAKKALGLCKFQPAMVDGKPEKDWARIEYEWRLLE